MHVVIVGASLGGLRTAQALRNSGSRARITVVGEEMHLPYDRPPLSKGFLRGDPDADGIRLAAPEELAGLGIELRTGERAVRLDPGTRRITLDGGGTLSYDALVIATGSEPRTLPGSDRLAGVHTLRTVEDATAIRGGLTDGAGVVVVGGGFIGAEVAATVRELGHDVTIVDPLPVLMSRVLGPVLGAGMARMHTERGVQLRLGSGVASFEGTDRVEAVRLTDGSVLPADLVVVGVGAVPATGWLAGSGLRLEDGVVCDAELRAVGAEGVYAVGDVARWHHPRYGEHLRVEHWTNAADQANAVAGTLTGTPTACDSLPYVWTDQFGAHLQIIGRVRPEDQVCCVLGEPGDDSFLAVTGDGTALHAVVGRKAIRQSLPFRSALMTGASWADALALAEKAADGGARPVIHR